MMEATFEKISDRGGNSSKTEEDEMHQYCSCETIAERICINCEKKLCIRCSREHEATSKHLVVDLNEQETTKRFKESDFCTVHEDQLAELYCAFCKKIVCSVCEIESHSSHNCSRVNDAADFISKQAAAEYENLFDIQRHFERQQQMLRNEEIEVSKKAKEMEMEIRKRCDEITTFVYNETKDLLKELNGFKKERLEEIEMERKRMEEHAFVFEKFKEYCEQIKRNANPRFTCDTQGVLRSIVDDLSSRIDGRWKSKLFSVQFSVQKTETEQLYTILNGAVGKLIIQCPYKLIELCEVKLDEKEVVGMAQLHDKLYVLSKSKIAIRRLEHPFTSVGEIWKPDMKFPKDIVSCSKASCLYIFDSGECCVWKIDIPSHRLSHWLSDIKDPCALSVTSNAELLLLRNSKPICLEFYNESAILVRRLKLSVTMPSLSRVIETSGGKYIGLAELSLIKFRSDGSIISQFIDSKHSDKPQCYHWTPYHIFLHCGSCNGVFNKIYRGSISSLAFDLASHEVLVDKSIGWKTPVTSFHVKISKQLLVLVVETLWGNNETWNLRAYDVLPQ